MKKVFVLLLCLMTISFNSCNIKERGQQKAQERARIDSLRNDSIIKANALNDSLAEIAWGDVKFGMTKQEVMASKAFGGDKTKVKETGSDYYDMPYNKCSDIRNLYKLSSHPSITASFKENELYQIWIESYNKYASELEDLANDCGIYVVEFMKKYGEPDYLNKNVSIIDFKNHQFKIATFTIGSKEIWVGLKEKDSEYKYVVIISNSSYPKKKHVPTEQELKEQKEKEAKEKEVRENSF